ncbi:aminotransferase class V-fold PLP-dependent enzyme [Natroniella sulfidigena]|uniref:aminotransferase class V-fold PLP-dependent enzyme n=1 Tax=Natroniella sulfidigena TaxID=723921 RepID=UPI00200B2C84|nr:aminotransferase class V-fold PLP-dependent enzyme [Natroniella sulfidigena]MCK8816632.1 aminotransferase class V-fold PLP-dependent enzyme [Natroniella sulfidigena]
MIYLDNAATTWPKPEQVYQAIDDFMRNYGANPGRAGHQMANQAGEIIYTTRKLLAKLFNAEQAQEIIFTGNATEALNLAIKGYLKPGEHTITTSLAHNSILRPVKALEKQGVEVSIVDPNQQGQIQAKQIKNSIQENTKLVVMGHASNVTGTLLPIEEVAQLLVDSEVKLLVDAAQTAGVYPIDLQQLEIDMLAFTGHKGLFGPQGTGGLYLKEGVELEPLMQGGTGSYSEDVNQPQLRPDCYESGTPNTVGIAGLKAGVEFVLAEGLDKIRRHEEKLVAYLQDELKQIPEVTLYGPMDLKRQVPLLSFNLGLENAGEIGYILDKVFNIAVRTGLHCAPLVHQSLGTLEQGVIRVSPSYFNTEEEMEEFIMAINEIADEI